MNKKSLSFLVTTLAIASLVFSSLSFFPGEAAASNDPLLDGATFHVNMKSANALSSETKGDANESGETLHVTADYESYEIPGVGGGRRNPQWVDVGTWSSTRRDSAITIEDISVTFNIWYSIAGETTGAESTFRFTLSMDGEQIAHVEGSSEDPPGNQIREYTASVFPDISYVVPAESVLELYIEYKAYEDCDVYFDSANYDSGFFADSNFCKVFGYKVSTNSAKVEIYDAFDANWEEVSSYLILEVDGSAVSAEIMVEQGKTRNMNGTDFKTSYIEWIFETPVQEGQSVDLYIKYVAGSKDEAGYQLRLDVGEGAGTLGGSGNGDDGGGDDNDMIYAAGGIGAVVVVVGLVLFRKKRGGSEEKEDFDEDEDDEDEEYDEDEEMDYED